MKRVENVRDLGIVLKPDNENEVFFDCDGGGIREAIINCVNGIYYLFYDGAKPGKNPSSYWNACLAVSSDLKNWEKRGIMIKAGAILHPEGSSSVYKDFKSAASPWVFEENGKWFMFYLGAESCGSQGVPSFGYYTLLATADSIEGPWNQKNNENGCEDHICFPLGENGTWDDATASPGHVLINPLYDGTNTEKKYLMFYSGSCRNNIKRSIGIARTDKLEITDSASKKIGSFWIKDPLPILPPKEDIENTSMFFDEATKYWYLFTNRIYNNHYTDAVVVYRSKDLFSWDSDDKAVVIDNLNSSWAKGAIGMPSVVKKDDNTNTLLLFYDGCKGNSIDHLDRCIGMAEISLPIKFN